MHKLAIKKIWTVARNEYIRWICNSRMFILVVLVVFIREFAVVPLIERAVKMNEPLNLVEPFIAVINSGILLLVLPFVYLTLICDFPKVDGNMVFMLPKVGRKNWLAGEILFFVLSFVSFLLVVFLSTSLMTYNHAYVYNGWSITATDYSLIYPDSAESFASELLPANLFNQMTPYRAAVISSLFLLGYMLILVLLLLLFTIIRKKILGLFFCCFLISLGTAGCALKADWMWLFPMAHSITWLHYTKYYRRLVMTLSGSAIYFSSIILLLVIICLICIKRVNLDRLQED